jgi:hypothetical protein
VVAQGRAGTRPAPTNTNINSLIVNSVAAGTWFIYTFTMKRFLKVTIPSLSLLQIKEMYWFLSRFPTKIQLLSILRLGIRFVALTTGCVREYVKSKAGLLIKDFFGAFIPVDFLGAKKQKSS